MPKLLKETIIIPPPGRWNWNDETQTLEFASFKTSVEVIEKRKNTKPINLQDLSSKRPERQTQFLALNGGQSKMKTRTSLRTNKSSVKQVHGNYVTLEDVKHVALGLLQEKDALPIPICFLPVLKSKELNDFLAALLLYLSCYFERMSLEKKPKPLMAEQSISEKQVMAETVAKVELAQKQLAFCYSLLVLGLGRSQQQHMASGRSHVSSTNKDRQLYECLYSFFCYVAWVTFSRNDLRGIQEEVGHLLRSDTFNPAIRIRAEGTEDTLPAQDTFTKEGQTDTKKHSQSHNATEQRRSERRPALCKIITQRSPLMVSLLPLPSEDAPHLFSRSRPRKQSQAKLSNHESLMGDLKKQLASCRFGILGKPLSQFSCTTLMPKNDDDDNDNDEDPDIHVRSHMPTNKAQRPMASPGDQQGGFSRADTVTSQATTEPVSSDTD